MIDKEGILEVSFGTIEMLKDKAGKPIGCVVKSRKLLFDVDADGKLTLIEE